MNDKAVLQTVAALRLMCGEVEKAHDAAQSLGAVRASARRASWLGDSQLAAVRIARVESMLSQLKSVRNSLSLQLKSMLEQFWWDKEHHMRIHDKFWQTLCPANQSRWQEEHIRLRCVLGDLSDELSYSQSVPNEATISAQDPSATTEQIQLWARILVRLRDALKVADDWENLTSRIRIE